MKTVFKILIWISVCGVVFALPFVMKVPALLMFFIGIVFGIIGRLAHNKVQEL